MLSSIGARLCDERVEEFRVVPGLRMPEHPDGEALPGVFERLDRAVVGPCHLAQVIADAADALVVMRLNGSMTAEHRREPRRVVDLDAVLREDPPHLTMLLVADRVGQVLLEVAP